MSDPAEADQMTPFERQLHKDALMVDGQEHQNTLYPEQPMPPTEETIVETPNGGKQVVITGVKDPVQAIAFMHPEFAEAARQFGVDLSRPAGRELEQMRKYFGQGSGTYLVTVDFQVARTEAFKLDERAQKKITKALSAKPKKRKKSTRSKKATK